MKFITLSNILPQQTTSKMRKKKTFVKNVNLMIYSKFCTYKRVRVIFF